MPGGKFCVYVIELDKSVANVKEFRERNPDMNPNLPCFYVGQTRKHPAVRDKEHRIYKYDNPSDRILNGYWVKRREDLYAKYNPIPNLEEAIKREEWLANKLKSEGHGVWVGLGIPK